MAVLVSRRVLLRILTVAPAAAYLAACGGSDESAPTTASGGTTSGGTTGGTSGVAASPAAAIPTSAAAPTAFSASASPTSATPAASGQVRDVSFTVVDGTEPNSLDPAVGTGPFQHIINGMFDTLVSWNADMQVEPSLATSWQVSSDGHEWTFKLRPNVKFHDGSPFTSAAVKATIDHIMDPNTLANRRANYTLIKEVRTPDDLTAVFVTDPPNPDFPFLLADGSANIIAPAALEKMGGAEYGRKPVGTGAFKFEEWVPNDHVSAVINPDYWGTKPQVRRLVYKAVPEAATRVVVLKNGEADVVLNLPPADVANLKQDPNLTITSAPGLTVVMAEMRQTKPPLNDKRVRYALNQSVDKDAIIKNIMRGLAFPLKTPSNPGLWGTAEFDIPPFDPNKAKELLAEAGYAGGIDVTLSYVSGRWSGDDQVVQAIQGYWNNIGVRTTIKKVDQAGLDADLTADPDTVPGLIVMPIRTSSYTDYQLYRMYQSEATHAKAAQRSGYSNPRVDELIAQERSIFDPEKRLPILKELQQVIWEDQPFVYLFSTVNNWGQRKNVSGFSILPTNQFVPKDLKKT